MVLKKMLLVTDYWERNLDLHLEFGKADQLVVMRAFRLD